jgi:hypothetical protein
VTLIVFVMLSSFFSSITWDLSVMVLNIPVVDG